MIKFTEREVRDLANLMKHGDDDEIVAGEMLTQLADMLAEREKAEPVAKWEKSHYGDYPVVIWRGDYRAKVGDKLYTHPAAQPRIPECQHEWVSGDNQYVKNAEVCLKCDTIRAAQESGR